VKLGNLIHMLQMFPTNYEVGVRLREDEAFTGKITAVAPAGHKTVGGDSVVYTKVTWMSDDTGMTPIAEIHDLLEAFRPYNRGNPVIFDEKAVRSDSFPRGCSLSAMDPQRIVAVVVEGELSPTVWIEVESHE
jgi:hypothetical protein